MKLRYRAGTLAALQLGGWFIFRFNCATVVALDGGCNELT